MIGRIPKSSTTADEQVEGRQINGGPLRVGGSVQQCPKRAPYLKADGMVATPPVKPQTPKATCPSSSIGQAGLWAISHAWPSGSAT